MSVAEILISDHNGETHILLDDGGDHIVTRFIVEKSGAEHEVMLPRDTIPWDRAVRRAQHGVAFL